MARVRVRALIDPPSTNLFALGAGGAVLYIELAKPPGLLELTTN